MKNFIKEFKEFAFKGSLLDLAIGIIIGGAVAKLVGSLVADIIMPLVGLIFGSNIDFTALAAGPIKYGNFLTILVDFIIVAFILFMIIRGINRFKKKEEVVAGPTVEDLLMEIRDELRRK